MTSLAEDFEKVASPDEKLWHAVDMRFGGDETRAAIAAGANVNAVDEKGYSVLMHTVRERRWEGTVPLLIAAGANVRYVAPDGESVYTICKDKEGDPVALREYLNMTAGAPALQELLEAIRKQDADAAQGILESRRIIDINLPVQRNGWRAIDKCISEDALVCLDLVLQAGANPNHWYDKAPLMEAIMSHNANALMVRKLLEYGADPDAGHHGGFPMVAAAERGQESTIYLLLEHGADVNINAGIGQTPVHAAAHSGNAEIIRILATNGANLNALNDQGQPPLEVAILNRHREAYDALIECGADPLTAGKNGINLVIDAAWAGEASLIPALVARGIPLNARATDENYTALMYAAMRGKGESVRVLLDLGADYDLTDASGKTALDLAKEKGHVHIERMLTEQHAADVKLGKRAPAVATKPFRIRLEPKNG